MAAVWIRTGVLMLALMAPAMTAHAREFAEDLRQADAVRTSDPAAFARALDRLDGLQASASPAELRHLRLLHDYRRIIAGEYEAAIGDAVALFDQAPEPELKYRAALLIANTSAMTRDFTLGLRFLERALALQPHITDRRLRLHGHGVAATVYNQYGQYALGLHHADLMLAENPDGRARCYARQMRIEARSGLNQPIDEDADVQSAIADCVAQKEAIGTNLIRANLAQRWAAAGRKRQAVALLDASLPEVQGTGYSWLNGQVRSLLAQYRLDLGDTAAAEAHARAVVAIKGQDPRWLPNVTAHHVLYRIALQRGDHATALDEYREYAEAEKARLDDVKAREYAFQLSRHELNQKNQSIELLSNQNQVLRLQQEVARRTAWNSRLAIALLIVLAGSAAYWGWRARRMHRSLRELAETDGLTGLSNRRHFRAAAEAALEQAAQQHRAVCVLLLDLDHFKQINDQCGHASGDAVLREVARVGREHCRPGDLWGRIGGEEFAMVLVDCPLAAAQRVAEDLRGAIASIDPDTAACSLPVTASVGVVSTASSGYDYEALVAHADAAMYRSKVGGRNRVTTYEAPAVPAGDARQSHVRALLRQV